MPAVPVFLQGHAEVLLKPSDADQGSGSSQLCAAIFQVRYVLKWATHAVWLTADEPQRVIVDAQKCQSDSYAPVPLHMHLWHFVTYAKPNTTVIHKHTCLHAVMINSSDHRFGCHHMHNHAALQWHTFNEKELQCHNLCLITCGCG